MSDLATILFRKMIRTWENTPDVKQRAFPIDYSKFDSTFEEDEFFGILKPLFATGNLLAIRGKGVLNSRIERIRLVDPEPLYSILGMESAEKRSAAWMATLSEEAEDWETPVITAIVSEWLNNKKWQKKLGPSDIDVVLSVQKLARAIRAGEWEGKDHRTLCSRLVDDSKFIEARGAAVFAYTYHGREKPGETTRAIIEALGLQKSGVPVSISGPFKLAGYPIGESVDYLGIGDNDLSKVSVVKSPKYLLTIENRESFNRHVVEINQNKDGVIVYTGGQPAHNVQLLYTNLLTQIDETVPVFHWSDIDLGGLEIFTTLHRLCPGLRPHLMSRSLLERYGKTPSSPMKIPVKNWPSEISEIADAMNGDLQLTLEQEILDPRSPV